MWGFKPFVSQGDTLDFEFPPDCGLLWAWGGRFMARLCPSLLHPCSWASLLSHAPVGGPQSVSEEVVPHEAVNPLRPQKEHSPPPAMPSS